MQANSDVAGRPSGIIKVLVCNRRAERERTSRYLNPKVSSTSLQSLPSGPNRTMNRLLDVLMILDEPSDQEFLRYMRRSLRTSRAVGALIPWVLFALKLKAASVRARSRSGSVKALLDSSLMTAGVQYTPTIAEQHSSEHSKTVASTIWPGFCRSHAALSSVSVRLDRTRWCSWCSGRSSPRRVCGTHLEAKSTLRVRCTRHFPQTAATIQTVSCFGSLSRSCRLDCLDFSQKTCLQLFGGSWLPSVSPRGISSGPSRSKFPPRGASWFGSYR